MRYRARGGLVRDEGRNVIAQRKPTRQNPLEWSYLTRGAARIHSSGFFELRGSPNPLEWSFLTRGAARTHSSGFIEEVVPKIHSSGFCDAPRCRNPLEWISGARTTHGSTRVGLRAQDGRKFEPNRFVARNAGDRSITTTTAHATRIDSPAVYRRALLALSSHALLACSDPPGNRSGSDAFNPALALGGRWTELSFEPSEHYAHRELALVAKEPGAPILIALHGRGESGRGLEKGSRGWRDDYWLDAADARLKAPPLVAKDFQGFVTTDRLAAINASLAKEAYRGLNVVCPYAPHDQGDGVTGERTFAGFLAKVLLPRVREEIGAKEDVPCAIDGVSMGGRLALYAGLTDPATFRGLGGLQPAIHPSRDDFAKLVSLAKARGSLPNMPPVRLVSSEQDPFLEAVGEFTAALTAAGVESRMLVTPGPHDYVWNRGPGSIEMLLWHERTLRGLAPA